MHDPYMHCSSAELAITCGRPVLVAPPTAPPPLAKQVLVAWKGTREARRALSDAMPFFEKAERVVVLASAPAPISSRRCTRWTTSCAPCAGAASPPRRRWRRRSIRSFHILRQTRLEGADLIVCGAYGRSRLGEWVFGGVAANRLLQDQAYLLLSH